MHGQSIALAPQGERFIRIGETPLVRSYDDYDVGAPTRGVDLQRLWATLARNRGLMLLVFALALLAGAASIWLVTPVYSGQATIQIDPQVPRIVGTEDVAPDPGRSETERVLRTQVDLVGSRSTADHVARKLKLSDNPAFLRDVGLQGEPAGAARDAKVTTALQDRLSISSPRDTRLIVLRYDSHDPALATRTANAFAETFIADSLQRRLSQYNYSRNFLQGQMLATKSRLEGSEQALVSYARAAGLVDAGNAAGAPGTAGERRSITTASLIDLNAAYSQSQANRMQAQQRWQQALATPAMSLPDVLGNPAIQNLTRQRAELEATLQQERQRRQDEHPAIIQAKAQIAELDRQIATIAGGVRASIGNQYRVAAGQEAALRGNVNALKTASFVEQGKGVRYNILKREADTNRNLYNTLLQRFQDVSTQAANVVNPISIIDRAQMPSSPAYPRPALNMALAGLAGVALAFGAAFARNGMDDQVHGPTDVERDFGAPLLGVVPLIKGDDNIAEALGDPLSAVTEAHHSICLALDPVVRTAEHSVLLLTSSCANEGKSTMAVKLAANLAAAGKNVLIVDADMRRGSLHRIFGVSNDHGLANLLSQGAAAKLSDAVQFSDSHGFSVLTRGRSAANPAELLSRSIFASLLDDAANQYDAVIIDGPPVLGLADAPRIAGMADATLFVIEANRASKSHAKIALTRLGEAGATQIGVIISNYDPDKDSSSSRYAYSYDYASDDEGSLGEGMPAPSPRQYQAQMAV